MGMLDDYILCFFFLKKIYMISDGANSVPSI